MIAAGRAGLDARGLGQRAVGLLVQADDHGVARQLAGGRRDRAHAAAAAGEALDARAQPQRDAALLERLVHRLGDVGIEHLREHPRPLVDEVDLQPAVAEVAGHLDAQRGRADHGDALHPVELLVEQHRGADVLDVVQPLEVRARDVGLLPHEAGADHELVEPLVGVARGQRPAVHVDVGDRRLHAHVEPVLDVALDRRQEEVLELVDLAAVDERDAARGVGDVGELGEQRHLEVGVDPLGDGGRGRARAPATDHDQTLAHVASRDRYSTAGGSASVFDTQHTRLARTTSSARLLAAAVGVVVRTMRP